MAVQNIFTSITFSRMVYDLVFHQDASIQEIVLDARHLKWYKRINSFTRGFPIKKIIRDHMRFSGYNTAY